MQPPPTLDPRQRSAAAGDDIVQPFQIDRVGLRGRLVRLGPSVDAVLRRHDYPEPVARLLGEAMALAACLAAALKYEGIFTLQARGEGAVRFLVADVTSAGHLRGYAAFDADKVAAVLAQEPEPTAARLFGGGHLAFTVDQGRDTQLYQGIVPLEGANLAESVHHYFQQSEQIGTAIKVGCGFVRGAWRACALMIQRLPEETAGDGFAASEAREAAEEGWRRSVMLLGSATRGEMLDPDLDANTLLYRLFHEDGVRIFPHRDVEERCRCGTRERIAGILGSIAAGDLADLKLEDGSVTVTCEFCRREERFDETEVDRIAAGG